MILKYAYMLDFLIHHIAHMTHDFDYTWPVLQNFEKTKCPKPTGMKFNQVDLAHFVFSNKVLKNLQCVVKMCYTGILCHSASTP